MAIGFSVLAFGSGTLENKPVVWFPQLTGEANRDVVVRNVCDRDRRGPRRGGDRRLGSAGDWLVLGATLNRSESRHRQWDLAQHKTAGYLLGELRSRGAWTVPSSVSEQ